MEQTELNFIKRPTPEDLFQCQTQNYRLYSRLLQGSVTSREIITQMNIFKYTSRISDIREALRPHLIRIEARRIQGGLWEYRLKSSTDEKAAA